MKLAVEFAPLLDEIVLGQRLRFGHGELVPNPRDPFLDHPANGQMGIILEKNSVRLFPLGVEMDEEITGDESRHRNPFRSRGGDDRVGHGHTRIGNCRAWLLAPIMPVRSHSSTG